MTLVRMVRLPLIALLSLYTATGLASAGHASSRMLLAEALAPVAAFLVFAVLVNDLSDEAIDRVNLPDDPHRLIVSGAMSRRGVETAALAAAVIAIATSLVLPHAVTLVTVCGLALSAAYSLRPMRLAERGAVASLVLPAGYVAVPFLAGVFATGAPFTRGDALLLAGLYVGFVGRILLKDFRDVRGDLLFGKRTFLVRHGRRATCWWSARCWAAGGAILGATRAFAAPDALLIALAIALVLVLGTEGSHRRDERLISAIAILGRGVLLCALTQLLMSTARWSAMTKAGFVWALATATAGQALTMARHGAGTRLRVPSSWPLPQGHHRLPHEGRHQDGADGQDGQDDRPRHAELGQEAVLVARRLDDGQLGPLNRDRCVVDLVERVAHWPRPPVHAANRTQRGSGVSRSHAAWAAAQSSNRSAGQALTTRSASTPHSNARAHP